MQHHGKVRIDVLDDAEFFEDSDAQTDFFKHLSFNGVFKQFIFKLFSAGQFPQAA
jgi:hypothetical protein